MDNYNYTDQTVPIFCGDCVGGFYIDGYDNMVTHLFTAHGYSLLAADRYARKSMEASYHRLDVESRKMTETWRGQ